MFESEDSLSFDQQLLRFHADIISTNATLEDINMNALGDFLEEKFRSRLPYSPEERLQFLREWRLVTEKGVPSLGCVLLFAHDPERIFPYFGVRVVRCLGNGDSSESRYFVGPLGLLFRNCANFIMQILDEEQGKSAIPRLVVEELLVNALVHREYVINTPIQVFLYDDRMEIRSPGSLPAYLEPRMLRDGVVFLRNPFLFYWASRGLLPCLGLGIGIRRALSAWPDIQFNEDVENNRFTAIVSRRAGKASKLAGTGGSEIGTGSSEKGAIVSEDPASVSEKSSEKGAIVSEESTSMSEESSEKGAIVSEDPASVSEKSSEKGAIVPEGPASMSEKSSEKETSVSEDPASVSEKSSEKETSVSEKILEILRKDPTSSARRMAEQLRVSSRTVERHLAVLRLEGQIYRSGPAKGGSWGLR